MGDEERGSKTTNWRLKIEKDIKNTLKKKSVSYTSISQSFIFYHSIWVFENKYLNIFINDILT